MNRGSPAPEPQTFSPSQGLHGLEGQDNLEPCGNVPAKLGQGGEYEAEPQEWVKL